MADISYTPTTWADGAEGGTPIDAAKLNNIEQGIVDSVAAIGPNDTTADGTLKAQIDTLSSSVPKIGTFTGGVSSYGANESWYTDITVTVPSGYYIAGVISVEIPATSYGLSEMRPYSSTVVRIQGRTMNAVSGGTITVRVLFLAS